MMLTGLFALSCSIYGIYGTVFYKIRGLQWFFATIVILFVLRLMRAIFILMWKPDYHSFYPNDYKKCECFLQDTTPDGEWNHTDCYGNESDPNADMPEWSQSCMDEAVDELIWTKKILLVIY